MAIGLCAQCKHREGCGFRQPGTWVTDCNLFDERPSVEAEAFRQGRLASMKIPQGATATTQVKSPRFHATPKRRGTR